MATAISVPIEGATTAAHDRFLRSFGKWMWGGVIVSVILHFLLFQFFPAFRIAELAIRERVLEAVALPPEIEVPPPPQLIQRPAVPVVARREIAEEITIAPTTFEANPVENLPPPPEERTASLAETPVFTPYDVAPEVKDREKARKIVLKWWPSALREAGVGGRVDLLVFIDDKGRVVNQKVGTTSGFAALDEAAMEAVTEIGREVGFTPAMNRDRRVPVWIRLPIVFRLASETGRTRAEPS